MGGLSHIPAEPTFVDVLMARRRLSAHLRPTPFHESLALGEMLGLRPWIKYENHQPTVAFKVRGTLNRMLNLSDQERAHGVVTASAGNHGQGVSRWAGSWGCEPPWWRRAGQPRQGRGDADPRRRGPPVGAGLRRGRREGPRARAREGVRVLPRGR